jgi:hypothetical protein
VRRDVSQGRRRDAGARPAAPQGAALIPYTAGFGNADERCAVAMHDFCLRREDPVHDLSASGDYWAQLVAVDQLGGARLLVAGEAGDLPNRDAACGT